MRARLLAHSSVGDRLAEAHAIVSLVEQEGAQHNEVASEVTDRSAHAGIGRLQPPARVLVHQVLLPVR